MIGKILVFNKRTSLKLLCVIQQIDFSLSLSWSQLSAVTKLLGFTLDEASVIPALPSCRLLLLSSSQTPDKEYVIFVRRHIHREATRIFRADRLRCESDVSCRIYRIASCVMCVGVGLRTDTCM